MRADQRPHTFQHNHEQAQRSAREQLKFIIENKDDLRRVREGGRMLEAAESFTNKIRSGGRLTPAQMSYIDGMYEKIFKAAGYESVSVHVDKKPKGLRYGR